jgi:hypothetical protein
MRVINNEESEGWDSMLELIELRNAGKAEWLERLGLVEKDAGRAREWESASLRSWAFGGRLAGWSTGA